MNTQLQDAILNRNAAVVKHVLRLDPLSINQTNEVGFTALMISCTTEQPEIAELLLKAGADVNAKAAETGFCALHCVLTHPPISQSNCVRLVEILLMHGADINAKSLDNETPLMFAAWFNHDGAARFLLKKGADADMTDSSGRTAKDMAIIKGNTSIVNLMKK